MESIYLGFKNDFLVETFLLLGILQFVIQWTKTFLCDHFIFLPRRNTIKGRSA